jgi:hypothetical protein
MSCIPYRKYVRNMGAEGSNSRLTRSGIDVVAIPQLLCGACFGQRTSVSGETETVIHLSADAKGRGTPLVHFWSKG